MKTKADRLRAARELAAGRSKSAASRAAKVNRATIGRWLLDPEFQDMILEEREKLEAPEPTDELANKGLADLVPKAIALLEEALSGSGEVTVGRAQVALRIVAEAAKMGGKGEDEVTASLGSILEKLDEAGVGTD